MNKMSQKSCEYFNNNRVMDELNKLSEETVSTESIKKLKIFVDKKDVKT